MKKSLIIVAVVLVLGSLSLWGHGLRLGITSVDHYGYGARVLDVFPGYPAQGHIWPGDVITHVGYYYGNVHVYSGYATMGTSKVMVQSPMGQSISGSRHLQSVILGAPYNSVVAIWLQRHGRTRMVLVQLLNPMGGFPVIMTIP